MLSSSPLTAGVTLLIVLLMFGTCFAVGKGRHRYGVKAPSVTGHPTFERLYRVQMNTLEWAAMCLPCLWICAAYVSDGVAAGRWIGWAKVIEQAVRRRCKGLDRVLRYSWAG